MSALPEWPEDIKREGPYKIYKGVQYDVYDDGNSADTAYNFDLAEAALARLRVAMNTIEHIRREGDNSGEDGESLDYISQWTRECIEAIGPLPDEKP